MVQISIHLGRYFACVCVCVCVWVSTGIANVFSEVGVCTVFLEKGPAAEAADAPQP